MTPRAMANRYRIWAYCNDREWDVTLREIANAIDLPIRVVQGEVAVAKWHDRIRNMATSDVKGCSHGATQFGALGSGASRALANDVASGKVQAVGET